MTHSPLKCRITDANIVTFQTDGAICLRDAFDQKWIEILRKGIEQNRLNPSAMTKRKGHSPLFFHDYKNWRSIPEYEEFIFQSGAGEIAATLLQSSVSVNDKIAVFVVVFFFHDSRSPSDGASISHRSHWSQPFPE